MTDLKELAREAAVDGMVRIQFVERLIDIARSEGELRSMIQRSNAK